MAETPDQRSQTHVRFPRHLCDATRATLANPLSYGAAVLIGWTALLSRDLPLGFVVPFLMPLVVQTLVRAATMMELEKLRMERASGRRR